VENMKKSEANLSNSDLQQQVEKEMKSHFIRLYNMWRHDGIAPLEMIKGYAELLLGDESGDLNDQQRETLELIYKYCKLAINRWHHPSNYLTLYSDEKIEFETLSLLEEVDKTVNYLREYFSVDEMEITLSEDLPPIKGSKWISLAIAD
jgi:signal transduction histidine kinase